MSFDMGALSDFLARMAILTGFITSGPINSVCFDAIGTDKCGKPCELNFFKASLQSSVFP